jgi:hypothetical protein
MYAALDARREITPRRAAAPFAELPPATAHHGTNAARHVALDLAHAGAHSHLHAYGEDVCLTGQCGRGLDILRGV